MICNFNYYIETKRLVNSQAVTYTVEVAMYLGIGARSALLNIENNQKLFSCFRFAFGSFRSFSVFSTTCARQRRRYYRVTNNRM